MSLTRSWQKEIIDYINSRINKPRRLVLGGTSGSGGGTGYPPGGIIGQLPQRFVTYDTTEDTGSGSTPAPSLVHNLNRIRGGHAIGTHAIIERHINWSTGCDPGTSGCITDYNVPFFSYSDLLATNVRDAIEEVYASTGAGSGYMWHTVAMSHEGDLEVKTGNLNFFVPIAMTAGCVVATLKTAPVGQDAIIDVNVNGVSMLDGSKVTIPAGNTLVQVLPTTTALARGDLLTMDIDQKGTTTPGADLVVHVQCKQVLQAI